MENPGLTCYSVHVDYGILHARSQKIMRGGGGVDSRSAEGASLLGHAPRKIFENLMQNGAFWGILEKKIAVYKFQNWERWV